MAGKKVTLIRISGVAKKRRQERSCVIKPLRIGYMPAKASFDSDAAANGEAFLALVPWFDKTSRILSDA